MDDELTPEEKFAAEDAETYVPRALRQGVTREQIIAHLMRLDWSPGAAAAHVDRVAADLQQLEETTGTPEARHQLVREARLQCVGGLLIILASILTAASAVMLFGASRFGVRTVIAAVVGVLIGSILAQRGWTRYKVFATEPTGVTDDGNPEET